MQIILWFNMLAITLIIFFALILSTSPTSPLAEKPAIFTKFITFLIIILNMVSALLSLFEDKKTELLIISTIVKKFNPYRVYIYYPVRLIFFIIKNIPTVFRGAKNFITRVIEMIHSDERIVAAFDVFLCSGIGYFCGSALIGFIAGMVVFPLHIHIKRNTTTEILKN